MKIIMRLIIICMIVLTLSSCSAEPTLKEQLSQAKIYTVISENNEYEICGYAISISSNGHVVIRDNNYSCLAYFPAGVIVTSEKVDSCP